jgi:hypothetical protein
MVQKRLVSQNSDTSNLSPPSHYCHIPQKYTSVLKNIRQIVHFDREIMGSRISPVEYLAFH